MAIPCGWTLVKTEVLWSFARYNIIASLPKHQCYNCTIKCWIVQDSPIDSIAANIAMQKCAASTQEAEDDLTVPAGHGITDLVSQTRDLGYPGC